LKDICVRPDSHGAFQAVAATTGSAGIDDEVSLGALWASLPDLGNTAGPTHPKALMLYGDIMPSRPPATVVYNGRTIPQPPMEPRPPHGSLYLDAELPADAAGRRELFEP